MNNNNKLSVLPAGVFSGLAGLGYLDLSSNQLNTLPSDVFAGLTNLFEVYLHSNPGADFPINIAVEKVGDGFRVRSDFAGPIITVGWQASGGSAAVESGVVFIPAGTIASAGVPLGAGDHTTLTLNPSLNGTKFTGFALSVLSSLALNVAFDQSLYTFGLTGGTGAVALGTVAAANAFGDPISYAITAGDGARFSIGASDGVLRYIGAGGEDVARTPSYVLVVTATAGGLSATAAVQVDTGICARTQPVREGIVAKIDGVSGCAAVTRENLGGISGELNLGGRAITAVQSVDFAGLTNLQSLGLEGNQLSVLPVDVFADLGGMQVLSLDDNQLSVLAAEVFGGLARLGGLGLSRNQLSTLPAEVFAGMSSLQQLSLSGNQLSVLPEGVFAGMSSLQQLSLSLNQLSALSADVFVDLTSLGSLNVSSNQLSVLSADVFAVLTSLGELRLQNNQLSVLPESVFAGSNRLFILDLHNNRLSSLPANVFAGLTNLGYLELQDNQLGALPANVFAGLTNLGYLELQDNQLGALPAGVFAGLSRLVTLRLSGNPGADFPIELAAEAVVDAQFRVSSDFAGPEVTVEWSASGGSSGVTRGTAVIPAGTTASAGVSLGATSYTSVALSNPLVIAYDAQTRIGVDGFALSVFTSSSADPLFDPSLYTFGLESSATGAVALGTVAATNTSGDPIEYTITAGDGGRFSIGASDGVLRYIGGGGEDVARTPYDLVVTATAAALSTTAAVQVDVRGICARTQQVQERIVAKIDGGSDCAAVTREDLGGISGTLQLGNIAMLAVKSVDFAGLSLLKYLYLNENDLSALPADVFADLTSLQVLNLRRSKLGALPMGVFAGLSSLRLLNLYDAGLSSLPEGVFADLTSLRTLYMFSNQLDALPAGVFAGQSSLQYLNLSNNGLDALPAGVFAGQSSLQYLDLRNNGLDALPAGVFAGQSSLQYLDLSNNGLDALSRVCSPA